MAKTQRYKHATREAKLLDAVDGAFGDISSLAGELEETRDALEEKWSQTDRYTRIEEAVSTLEDNADAPSCLDELSTVLANVTITIGETVPARKLRNGPSRQVRFDNAVSALNAAVEHLTEMADDNAEKDAEEKLSDNLMEALEAYRDDLQTVIDNLDGTVDLS